MQRVKMADEGEDVEPFGAEGSVDRDHADADEEIEVEEEEEDEEEEEEEEEMYGEIVQCWQMLPLIYGCN